VCDIINSSLCEGVVPTQWKKAIVVPIPKVIPTPSMDKLRPVSLTPTLAKVAETFVTNWVMQDLSQQLDPRPYGNRKARSTSHYLVQLVQYAHQALEDGCNVNLLAIDYSKAFDRVDITIALQKLLHMGVRRELLPWLSDFLSNRQQCVRVDGVTSDWRSVTCGVPQGTKVGPVVFLAMVNGVTGDTPDRFKFVDDITVGLKSKPTTVTVSPSNPMQDITDGICKDADDDNMMINAVKCANLPISASTRHDPALAPVTANGQAIPQVTSLKLLGVTIQNNLKWDTHVDNMISKANGRKYFILVLKRLGVELRDLTKCYCTFIRPLVEYAVPVWHSGLTVHQSDQLERVQKQTLHILLPDSSYREALLLTGLHTLEQRRIQLCRNFATGLLGSEFSCWLPPRRRECHKRNLRSNNKLSTLPCRTKRFSNSPIVFLAKLIHEDMSQC
jgi:hypothetical protein